MKIRALDIEQRELGSFTCRCDEFTIKEDGIYFKRQISIPFTHKGIIWYIGVTIQGEEIIFMYPHPPSFVTPDESLEIGQGRIIEW